MENTHCKHWQGSISRLCAVGIDWEKLTGGPQLGLLTRCPCIRPEHAAKCDQHALLTQEEFDAQEAEMERLMEETISEISFWNSLKATNKRGTSGICKCPRCGGDCRWSIASTNGHMHVACLTDGCVRFME